MLKLRVVQTSVRIFFCLNMKNEQFQMADHILVLISILVVYRKLTEKSMLWTKRIILPKSVSGSGGVDDAPDGLQGRILRGEREGGTSPESLLEAASSRRKRAQSAGVGQLQRTVLYKIFKIFFGDYFLISFSISSTARSNCSSSPCSCFSGVLYTSISGCN